MNTKILFTDLDGTLLNSDKTISEANLAAIDKLTRAGHKFVIATGRPIQSAIQISEKYGWLGEGYYIASFNGGLIYDCHAGKSIIKNSLSKEYVRIILDEAKKNSIHAHTYDNTNVVSERNTPELQKYCTTIMVPPVVVDNATEYLTEDPIKAIAISHKEHEVLDPFRERIISLLGDKVATVFSNPILLEFANPKATKGMAVKFMCQHFGLPISNSIAVGDEENDISMIEAAGIGVAMNNATETTKAIADYITINDNDHNGIAEVINKFILNA